MEAFLDDPPLLADAARPARKAVPDLLRRDLRRVRKRHRAYLDADTPDRRDRALHEIRKAAKRLRYSAEMAVPVLGARASTLSARAKALQQVLGEHQDSVVARQMLRDLGIRAHLGGENGFTFGRLHALEEAHAAELARQYLEVWAELPGTSGLRSWLRG